MKNTFFSAELGFYDHSYEQFSLIHRSRRDKDIMSIYKFVICYYNLFSSSHIYNGNCDCGLIWPCHVGRHTVITLAKTKWVSFEVSFSIIEQINITSHQKNLVRCPQNPHLLALASRLQYLLHHQQVSFKVSFIITQQITVGFSQSFNIKASQCIVLPW